MPATRLNNLSERIFRANPGCKLTQLDRLKPEEQQQIRQLDPDLELYGVLTPRDAARPGFKSVNREVALLFFTLGEPSQLPTYARQLMGANCDQAIARLVLDEVLQIECDGQFVAGAEAMHTLYHEPLPVSGLRRVARLSLEALLYAQCLRLGNAAALSTRLYCYNRVPASPDWHAHWPTPAAVAESLGLQEGGKNRKLIEQEWAQVPDTAEQKGWSAWQPRRSPECVGATHKLYVSPTPDCTCEAFGAAIHALSETGRAPAWKIGRDVYGLLRPDKMVIYVGSRAELDDIAGRLARAVEGLPAQGVPFTAGLDDSGMLSWGMDPPKQGQTVPFWRESWRLWVTNRLASALVAAQHTDNRTVEPWQFALERLQLEGVDTQTWTPGESIWREQDGEG